MKARLETLDEALFKPIVEAVAIEIDNCRHARKLHRSQSRRRRERE